mgnify:CR=1 FL=1
MYATQRCPFPAAWTPRQIADAVPPRMHELDFGLPPSGASTTAGHGTRVAPGGYLPRPALSPRFRING